MTTTIILTRHGQTQWNTPPLRFRGQADIALSETGFKQADAAARQIAATWHPDIVLASPLQRCTATARIIADASNAKWQVLDGLNDIDYGNWQGLTEEEVRAGWPKAFDVWIHTPQRARIPGGDSLRRLQDRVCRAVRDALHSRPGQTLVLVGHDSVNRVLLLHALKLPLSRYSYLTQNNCAISELVFADGEFHVRSINETMHLRPPLLEPQRRPQVER